MLNIYQRPPPTKQMECVWMVRLIADCNKMHHCMRHLLALYTIIWISNWSFEQLVLVYMLFKIVCIYFSISNPPLSVWGHPKQKLIMTSMHPKQKLNKLQYKHKLQYFCLICTVFSSLIRKKNICVEQRYFVVSSYENT